MSDRQELQVAKQLLETLGLTVDHAGSRSPASSD